jgi:transposase-like protein
MPNNFSKLTRARRSFTETQKLVAVQRARELQQNGNRSLYSIAKELEISQGSLKRWCDQADASTKAKFKSVEVIQASPAKQAGFENRQGICIAGLSVEDIAHLVKLLGT